jgi:hypothetical protein
VLVPSPAKGHVDETSIPTGLVVVPIEESLRVEVVLVGAPDLAKAEILGIVAMLLLSFEIEDGACPAEQQQPINDHIYHETTQQSSN